MYGCDVARDPVPMPANPVPPYGRRAGLVPRRQEDFGAGGAFPEVHVAQYPLSMGLRGDRHRVHEAAPGSSDVLAVTVASTFGAVVRQGDNAAKIVYSSHADLVPRIAPAPGADEDDEDEVEATTARTRAALQAIVDARISAVQPRHRDDPALVKYTPARQSAAFNSGAEERIVRVERAQEDPVLPPKHRRRRVPRPGGGSSSPPATVMHSPPRPVSREDMAGWKMPPSVSDWKNAAGYCIPLDKRAAASVDRRRMMQDAHQVSDGFASLSEALHVAEQKAREAIQTRAEVVEALKTKAKEQQEHELREIASRARGAAMAHDAAAARPPVERVQRDVVRDERRRQRECERRRAAASGGKNKKSRVTRDGDRDVSERIALGMASTGGAGEVACYNERLFNQDAGSGFAADDQYNVYSARLFAVQPAALSMLCSRRNKHGDSDVHGGADDIEKIARTGRFRPDKVFSGASEQPAVGKRGRPVEFDVPEEGGEADDPFVELDQYMAKVKEGKKH